MPERLTWRKAGQDTEEFQDCLILAMLRSGVCVIEQNEQMDYLFIANLPECWKVETGEAPTDRSLFGDPIAERLAKLKDKVTDSGDAASTEIVIEGDRVFEFVVELAELRRGGRNYITTIIDMSEERRREKMLRALLREVSHRSKNLLAIIHSIAAQTARHSVSLDSFLRKFRGRLYSLSRSQDLVTDSNWRGANLRDLVREQAERYLQEDAPAIEVTGEDIELSPNGSLHVGLALHELIVNAATHGALLNGGGRVKLQCKRVNGSDGDASVVLTWTEKLGALDSRADPEDDEGREKHFGSAVLERVVPAAVEGRAEYSISRDKIRYRLTMPEKEVKAAADSGPILS